MKAIHPELNAFYSIPSDSQGQTLKTPTVGLGANTVSADCKQETGKAVYYSKALLVSKLCHSARVRQQEPRVYSRTDILVTSSVEALESYSGTNGPTDG